MKIQSIAAKDFLSFREFRWDDIDPSLNLVVGPNGVGKTNLFRVVQAVRDSLTMNTRRTWEQAGSSAHGPQFQLALGLHLDAEWEKQLIGAFLAAAICSTSGAPPKPFDQGAVQVLSEQLFLGKWVVDTTPFESGVLHVAYYGGSQWEVYVEYLAPSSDAARLMLQGSRPSLLKRVSRPETGPQELTPLEVLAKRKQSSEAQSTEYADNTPRPAPTPLTDDAEPGPLRATRENPSVINIFGLLADADIRLEATTIQPALPTHRFLWQLLDPGVGQNTIEPTAVFYALLARGLAFTTNVRRISGEVAAQPSELLRRPLTELADGSQLAVHLFGLKNGSTSDSHTFAAVQRQFKDLTGLRVDVQLVEPLLPVGSEKNGIAIMVGSQDALMPLDVSGAGAAEALFIAAVMTTRDVPVLLLDEPGANLFHSNQVHLLAALRSCPNQVLVATHSQLLVPANDPLKVARFRREGGNTRRASLEPSRVSSRLPAINRALRSSSDARALLFAESVILVEGETEAGAFPEWINRTQDLAAATANSQIFSVGGHKGFGTYLTLLDAFEVPWVLFCDGPALQSPEGCIIAGQSRAAIPDLTLPADLPDDFQRRKMLLAEHGIFTLSDGPSGEFEGHSCISAHLQEAKEAVGPKSKARQGQWIAENYPCTHAVELLRAAVRYLGPE